MNTSTPKCPKCGRTDRMIFRNGEWVCHHTHELTDADVLKYRKSGEWTTRKIAKSHAEQLLTCIDDDMLDRENGPMIVMDPMIPNQKFIDYVKKNGKPPEFKASLCKRFGGVCSSGNQKCRELRGL